MKKRFFALALVMSMALQLGTVGVTQALPKENQSDIKLSNDVKKITNTVVKETTNKDVAVDAPVNFEVRLRLDFKLSEDEDFYKNIFSAQLTKIDGTKNAKEDRNIDTHVHTSFQSFDGEELVYSVQGVDSGKYLFSLESDKFYKNYTQEVEIKDGIKSTLYLSDNHSSNIYGKSQGYGIIGLGDLNADALIDELDKDILISHMGQAKAGKPLANKGLEARAEFETNYDLNQDGIIDVEDLAVLAHNYKKNEKTTGVVTEAILHTSVTVKNEQDNAKVEGSRSLDTIMQDFKEPIKVKPKNDGAISEANPIKVEMQLAESGVKMDGIVVSAPAESGPSNGSIEVEVAGEKDPRIIPITEGKTRSAASAVRKPNGEIEVNLGSQVAVKKVTIVVTGSYTNTNLTEIGKVEFLNGMKNRIPEPELNIPTNIKLNGKGDEFKVTWDAEPNVTGYEVSIYAIDKDGKRVPGSGSNTYKAGINEIAIKQFMGGVKDKVTSLWTYHVKVKSTNGKWSSPYSAEVEHYQTPEGKPEAPDNVKVNGKYRQLDVSWKDMDATEYYTLGYREKNSDAEFTEIHDIKKNSYSITGLKDKTEYEVYVYGWNTNDKGQAQNGPKSLPAIGKTIVVIPEFPKYKMINLPNKYGGLSPQITSIKQIGNIDQSKYPEGTSFDPSFISDGDYSTYFHSTNGYPNGVNVTFDKNHTFKEVILTSRLEEEYRDQTSHYSQIIFRFYDENNTFIKEISSGNETNGDKIVVQSLDPQGNNSMKFTLPEAVKAKRVEVMLSKWSSAPLTISEINFFEYDSIEDEVYGLYNDEMHVVLKAEVTETKINDLVKRLDYVDPVSGEQHPKRDLLLSELENARKLLKDASVGDLMNVNPNITKEGVNNSQFGSGLSGLQALGYVGQSGKTINVYAGQSGKVLGEDISARLVMTQYHPEASEWKSAEIPLKQGLNEIELPEVASLDFEKGGSLYVVQTNSAYVKNNPIQIRVSGATKIPTLDLHRPIGDARMDANDAAWNEAIRKYVTELKDYVADLENNHSSHAKSVGKDFDNRNCFLNSTEIALDNVLMSVPATEILKAISTNGDTIDNLVNEMYSNNVAMNQMVELFYKERGFNPALVNNTHGIPTARFNIRYHRMFAGAFMYAGGEHLGIEFDQVAGVGSGDKIVTDENGKYVSGNMFGWGIAHEMGHNADTSGVTIAEVTNNIWSQFEKSKDTADTSRIDYEKVYDKVTSNTIGKSDNVFVTLGMLWQLHLAYDNNFVHYNYYKNGFTAENYKAMLNGEFYARYYAIRRENSLAPSPGGIAYTNSNSAQQNIMRTAAAAAKKDLTEFFKVWGFIADEETAKYMGQFPKEIREIQYLSDSAREYKFSGALKMTSTEVTANLTQGTGVEAKKVTLNMSLPTETNMDAILGYEIIRNGLPVAFVMPALDEVGNYLSETEYVDLVGSENNKVFSYEVIAYDKHLNKTSVKVLDDIKIRHDGELSSDKFTATSNAVSKSGTLTIFDTVKVVEGKAYKDVVTGESITYKKGMDVRLVDSQTGELVRTISGAALAIDGDSQNSFEGQSKNGNAWIDIGLNSKENIVGIKFKGTATTPTWKFAVNYSVNGGNTYSGISEFEFITEPDQDGYSYAYFKSNNSLASIKGMTNLRINANNSSIGIHDVRLLSQTGDNVDIGLSQIVDGKEVWDTENTIGLLKDDFILDPTSGDKIPAGSFIVTGQYTGNAAFNVVKLFNQSYIKNDYSSNNQVNSIISGQQTFFAEVPDEGSIANVKNGTWIYWLEPLSGANAGKYGVARANPDGSDLIVELPTKVYAQLYRVDDAMTLANERLVSDSFMVDVPEILPSISLTGGQGSEPIKAVKAKEVEEN